MKQALYILLMLVMISCRDSTTWASPEAQDEEIATEVYLNIINFRLSNNRSYPTEEYFLINKDKFLGKWIDHKFAYYIELINGRNVPILIHLSSISTKGNLVFVMLPEKRISFLINRQDLKSFNLTKIKTEVRQKIEVQINNNE